MVINNKFKIIIHKYSIFLIIMLLLINFLQISSLAYDGDPDLTIYFTNPQDLDSLIEGENITVNVTVENLGEGNIEPGISVGVGLFIDDSSSPFSSYIISNGISNNTIRYVNLFWYTKLGNHSLKIKVDYDDYITESNESNNEQIKNIQVSDGPPKIIVTDIQIPTTIKFEVKTSIVIGIKNIQKNTTTAINAKLEIPEDDISITLTKSGGLSRNATYNFTFEWTPSHFANHSFKFTIKLGDSIHNQTNLSNYRYVLPYKLPWWNTNWHYRRLIGINGSGNYSEIINFTNLLINLGLNQKTFENNTIRVVEYSKSGEIITSNVNFNFAESIDYNNITNAKGNFTLKVSEPSSSPSEKYFYIYFDVEQNNESSRSSVQETSFSQISNFNVIYDNSSDGWWPEIIIPENDTYPFKVPFNLETST